ncbi:hypothetical protein HYS94_01640 [Candidatus Daviesbacteria bacterium]|nr:hypothetical protein [Candidatus Daviesbacteria bacterium]
MATNKTQLISLDIETSTSDVNTGVLLSIAMVSFNTGDRIEKNIRHRYLSLTPEAMRVNQIDTLMLDSDTRDPLEQAEEQLMWWLDRNTSPELSLSRLQPIPVGMNVGSFDMQFVRKYLPQISKKFGYRSLDLNALFFAEALKENEDFTKLKTRYYEPAMEFASKVVPHLKKHNPLFDCYINCSLLSQVTKVVPKWMSEVSIK